MLEMKEIPLLEFDPNSPPIVMPEGYDIYDSIGVKRKVRRCLITFFTEVVDQLERNFKINQIFKMRVEAVRPRVYSMKVGDEIIYVLPMPQGAPQAARMLEMLSVRGVDKFMVCGGAGTLRDDITGDKTLVPVAAVRDEGTSYHYLPPSREVALNPQVQAVIEKTLQEEGEEYVKVKTWTTDAIFRETEDKVALRKQEGCTVVEMECSAFYAVAQHKKLLCGQLLFAGDKVKKEGWDPRDWHNRTDKRIKLFNLALKCLMNL